VLSGDDLSHPLELRVGVVDLPGEVFEVFRIDRLVADLVEDREEVVERLDGRQRRGVEISEDAPRGGEVESSLDGVEWDSAVVELSGQPAVGGPDAAGGGGRAAVAVEDPPDVGGPIEGGIKGVHPWGSRREGPSMRMV
jgi:hypothetical protein